MKARLVVCEDMRADRQTDRQTQSSQYCAVVAYERVNVTEACC